MIVPAAPQPLPRLAVALDAPAIEPLEPILDQLHGLPILVKVGLSLFVSVGPSIVHHMHLAGFRVFLDLKLHDIPHQVGLAVDAAARLDVALLTVHSAGGLAMLQAAQQAARGRTKVCGVSVLTSLSDTDQHDTAALPVRDAVRQRLSLLDRAGLDGCVVSPHELPLVAEVAPQLLTVVPGIRATAGGDDQQRTASAYEAARQGASLLVVGRPIVAAADPRAACEALLAEIARGDADRQRGNQ